VPGSGYDGLELGAYGGITSEVEQLKRDRLLLLKEVMRLREVQSHTQDAVRELSARLASTEQFQSRMMSFVDAVQSGTGLSFDAQGMQKFKEVAATRKRRQMFLAGVDVAHRRSSRRRLRRDGSGDTHAPTAQVAWDRARTHPGTPASRFRRWTTTSSRTPTTRSDRRCSDRSLPIPPRPSNCRSTSGSTCSAAASHSAAVLNQPLSDGPGR
jgi:PAS domain-containing protein